jgi:hypothetical protein
MSFGSNPEGPKANKPTKTADQGWVKPVYLDISLDSSQREGLQVFMEEMERVDLLAWIGEKCVEGHVVEVKQEDEHYYARMTGIPGSTHAGLCLTARASTAEKVFYALAYRDVCVLAGKWPKTSVKVLDA